MESVPTSQVFGVSGSWALVVALPMHRHHWGHRKHPFLVLDSCGKLEGNLYSW